MATGHSLGPAANMALLLFAAVPLLAQGEFQEPEVYVIAGYSHVNDATGLCFFCLSGTAVQRIRMNGGLFGAGIGVRLVDSWTGDASLWRVEGEFFQSRISRLQEPYLNTGALNFVLEKRTGKVRPNGIVLGVGGAQGSAGGHFFLQSGVGVAVTFNERWFVRPELRLQWWTHAFDTSRVAISAGAAIGYRF